MEKEFDVIVAGGGLSGVAAVVAAAREGAEVLLLERYGFLGGMATAGLVNPFMAYTVHKNERELDWDRKVNQGYSKPYWKNSQNWVDCTIIEPRSMKNFFKLVLDRMLKKYNISVLLHSYVTGVVREGKRLSRFCDKQVGQRNTGPLILWTQQEMPIYALMQMRVQDRKGFG